MPCVFLPLKFRLFFCTKSSVAAALFGFVFPHFDYLLNFAAEMRKLLFITLLVWGNSLSLFGQNVFDERGNRIDGSEPQNGSHFTSAEDSTETDDDLPTGMFVWKMNETFGERIMSEIDTMAYQFQNTNFTDGITGQYNTLGNMGSPRMSRLYMQRPIMSDFLFADPFDFFLTTPGEFYFTNTLSPITNVTYHECGDKTDGEDRITALFAVNAGKKIGLGFKMDYLYGRGYYANQNTSQFNASIYGSYVDDKYEAYLLVGANHIKVAENGGIESDVYITNPASLSNKYSSTDIPTVLSKAWTKVYTNNVFFSHRYNLGFYRTLDKDSNVVKNANDTILTDPVALSRLDSLQRDSISKLEEARKYYIREFVPVTSFNHVLRIDGNTHRFINNKIREGYYLNQYMDGDSVNDRTHFLNVSNTFSVQLREGFSKWAKAGLSAFARHELMQYKLPVSRVAEKTYTENRFTFGGRLVSTQSKYAKYDVVGSVSQSGKDFGMFNVDGNLNLTLPLKKDTINLKLRAMVCNNQASFYYRHYHGKYAWWDNDDLDHELRTRFEGVLSYNRTRTNLRVSLENVKSYTYFAATQVKYTGGSDSTLYSNGIGVKQHSGSVQVVEAALNQNFKFGIFNWENELVYSTSSNKDVLPLPTFSAYSNVYLLFRIAKVLNVQFGADVKYFSEYYAPTYSPIIGQFAVQDNSNRIKIGNYPIIDVYANFHLKHTRFYLMASHVNKSSNGGHYFLVPHYPYNPMTIKFGISWNFFN